MPARSVRDAVSRLDPEFAPAELRMRGTEAPGWRQDRPRLDNDAAAEFLDNSSDPRQYGLWENPGRGLAEMVRLAPEDDRFSLRSILSGFELQPQWSFRLFWFNTFLLTAHGLFASKPHRKERAAELGPFLDRMGYDVAALCEVVGGRDERTVVESLEDAGRSVQHEVGPQESGIDESSGLVTIALDRVTIGRTEEDDFDRTGTIGQLDFLAQKGILYTELALHPEPATTVRVDLFTTHMYAPSEEDHANAPDVRADQIEQLLEFVAEHRRPENPVVIMGDFNVDNRFHEFPTLLATMEQAGFRDVWLSRGGPLGATVLREVTSEGVDLGIFGSCDFDVSSSAMRCDDRTKAALTQRDAHPGQRLDYVFIEDPHDRHSVRIDVARMRRQPAWRGPDPIAVPGAIRASERSLHPNPERWSSDVLVFRAQLGSPLKRQTVPHYLSDHLGLELTLLVSPR